jgi:hypothetical protein
MKNYIRVCSIISLLSNFICMTVKSQILNGSFSDWATDSVGRLDVVGWNTTNTNMQFSSPSVLQDTDHVGGNSYAMKMVCVYDSSAAGLGFTELDLVNAPFTNNINPTTLSGFWKVYNPNSQTQIGLDIQFYDVTNTQIGHVSIGTPFSGSLMNWTAFSKVITYTSTNPVASYSCQLYLFNLSQLNTPYGIVDDLTFDVSTSIDENENSLLTKLISVGNSEYQVLISQNQLHATTVNLYDLSGKLVRKVEGNAEMRQIVDLDLSTFSPGIYNCVIENGTYSKSLKLIVAN